VNGPAPGTHGQASPGLAALPSPTTGSAPAPGTSPPFQRIGLVLSGGGALGAYEVGVLRALDALKVVPSLVVGVSIGAINAVAWLAAGHDTSALEQVWRTARGETLGVRWVSLAVRLTGAFTTLVAVVELLLTALGSRVFSGAYWLNRDRDPGADVLSTQLDLALWIVLGLLGVLMVVTSRRLALDLERLPPDADPARSRRRLRTTVLLAAAVHVLVGLTGWPWPHRFSAAVVLLLTLAWMASTPGGLGRWLRGMALGLMPETGGRGLWSGRARRHILAKLMQARHPTSLVGHGTGLVVTALDVGSGRTVHFTSWPDVDPTFVARLAEEHGDVVVLENSIQLLDAAVASSAIPGVFQPERVLGRDCVDPAGFSNQPLHVALAAGVDAMLIVLLSPSEATLAAPLPADVGSLGGRLLELLNWRGLQHELRHLPHGWSRKGAPARVCVVEPRQPLPAAWLVFDPKLADDLIALGERDAREALARAGWIAPDALEPRPAHG